MGKKYNREKVRGFAGNQYTESASGKNYQKRETTAERIAEQYKVGEKTVRNAGQFTESVDTIATNVGEEVKQKILAGDSTLTKEAVIVIAKEEPEKQREIFASGEAEILRAAKEIKRERAQLRMAIREKQKAEAIGKFHPLAGERYNREKESPVGFSDRDISGTQNEAGEKTAEKLAAQYGVSRATIERDGQGKLSSFRRDVRAASL